MTTHTIHDGASLQDAIDRALAVQPDELMGFPPPPKYDPSPFEGMGREDAHEVWKTHGKCSFAIGSFIYKVATDAMKACGS